MIISCEESDTIQQSISKKIIILLAKYSLIPQRDNENMYSYIFLRSLTYVNVAMKDSYTNNRNDMRSAQETKTSVNTAISVDRSSILRFKKSINV